MMRMCVENGRGNNWRFLYCGIVLCIGTNWVMGQDLSAIQTEKPIKVNGGLSLSQTAYVVHGVSSRRDPYNYYLAGNLNLSLYGWSIPFAFTYSNREASFQQPFNQYGLSPRYKWITLHAGYRAMSFSPYTLNGHLFLGGGIELAPEGIFRLSAMYGRLQKAVQADTLAGQNTTTYERRGYGIKIGVALGTEYGHISLFHARDRADSLQWAGDDLYIAPQENLVIGFSGKKNLVGKFSILLDWGASAITRDVRTQREEQSSTAFSKLGGLYTFRNSSSVYQAIKTSINYTATTYAIGVNYERVDPEYQTFGSYYFNNDLENITISTSFKAARAAIAANVGVQQNDLDNTKLSKMNRLVASVTVSFSPVERLQASLSVSNFTSYTRLRPRFEDYVEGDRPEADTISSRYTQLSSTLNSAFTYKVGKKKNALNALYSATTVDDMQDTLRTESVLHYASTNFNFSIPGIQLSVSTGVNVSWNKQATGSQQAIGPSCQFSKEFFQKKMRSSAGFSYNRVERENAPTNNVFNIRCTANYKVMKKHTFSLSVINVFRRGNEGQRVRELTGNFNYGFSF